MRVRAPAQWRRKPSARVPTSSVGIWVTDRMLRRAIERYQRGSVASCRCLSSHTGPLESRRRLGKRHMTGVLPSSNPYRPAWHFEVLADRSTWQWEPPTSPTQRSARKTKPSVSSIFNGLIEWLEDSDADKPFIHPPNDAEKIAMPTSALPTEIISQKAAHEAELTQQPNREVLELRTAISSSGSIDETMLNALCRTCKRSLRRRIMHGELSAEELAFAMSPFDEQTSSLISDPAAASRGGAMIRRSILGSIADAQKRRPGAVSEGLWMALAKEICTMDGKSYSVQHAAQQFWRLVSTMPSSFREQIPYDQIFDMTSSFITAQASRNSVYPQWAASTVRFSNAIQMLTGQHRPVLIRKMKRFLEQEGRAEDVNHRVHFTWMLICALDVQSTRKLFLRRHREFVGTDMQLTGLELWQLMATRLISIGVLDQKRYRDLLATVNSSLSERWTSLALAILGQPNRDAGLEELRLCLDNMLEHEGLALALSETPRLQHWLLSIQSLVAACGDHSNDHILALEFYRALQSTGESGAGKMTRRWVAWGPYVERMIKDPKTEHRVFQILNLVPTTGTAMAKHGGANRMRAELLDNMMQWYMEAKHLNGRQKLRRVQQCINYQRLLMPNVSPRALVHATDAVTGDLQKGEAGRTARLEWLSRLINENEEPEKAKAAVTALKGWRWTNEQRRGRR